MFEQQFINFMEKFDSVPFTIKTQDHTYQIGKGEPTFSVFFHKVPSMSDLLTSTSIALGEAYMNGDIEIEGDLYNALNMFLGQLGKFSTDSKKLKHLIFPSLSKKTHKEDTDTLYDAQCNKVDRILEKLYLKEGMTLCDIGCGWGFLLIEAAKKYHVHGVGITLSQEQKKKFEERIHEEHLENLLEVHLLDYRDLPKSKRKFDRIVSVGMLEHVGRGNYEEFMSCVKSVLKPGGLFLLHYISALQEHPGDAWIKKYIFPGGVIPSLREIIQIAGDMRFYTIDVESLRRHYNKTLLEWNKNFQAHRAEVVEMFDEKFARMWELYLCACAATFQNGIIDLSQILFTNDVNNDLPMTRWY